MSYLNKVTIIGDLIKEPYYEVDKIANLRIATLTQYKNKEGEIIDKRNIHNVVVIEKNYIKKRIENKIRESLKKNFDCIVSKGVLNNKVGVIRIDDELDTYKLRSLSIDFAREVT